MGFKKINLLLSIIVSLSLVGCVNNTTQDSIEKNNNGQVMIEENISSKEEANIESSNVFLGIKSDQELKDEIWIKRDSKEFLKIYDGKIDSYSVKYLDKIDTLLFAQNNGDIKMFKAGNFETIGSNTIPTYRVANPYEYVNVGISYKVSKNQDAIAYTKKDGSLMYIDLDKKDEKKIAVIDDFEVIDLEGNIQYINNRRFKFSDDGKYIYYSTNNEMMSYNIQTNQSKRIGNDIYEEFSLNGKFAAYVDRNDLENTVVIQDFENNINKEYKAKNVRDVKVFDDGSAMFIQDFQEDIMSGDAVYIQADGRRIDINGFVSCYEKLDTLKYIEKIDNYLYYMTFDIDQFTLRKMDIVTRQEEILIENVTDFEVIKDTIYFSSRDIKFGLLKNGEKKIIDKGGEMSSYVEMKKVNENTIVAYDFEGNLFVNDKEVSKNIEEYIFLDNKVAYTTKDNKIYTFDIETKESKLEIENYKEFSKVVYGNNIFDNQLINN